MCAITERLAASLFAAAQEDWLLRGLFPLHGELDWLQSAPLVAAVAERLRRRRRRRRRREPLALIVAEKTPYFLK